MLRFTPKNLCVKRVGHLGAFCKDRCASVWERVVLTAL